jgi:transcriptional regulator with XRE-family HTH domain
MASVKTIGDLLRDWRLRRRLSQLELACEADISTRHLSFLETGRSIPSREMVLHLAEQLEVPKRERNVLLVAAGYAPIFPERSLHDPVLQGARKAIDLVLEAQKPYPAFALDRHWNIVASTGGLPQLYVGVSPALLARLKRQIDLTGDTKLADLLHEVSKYPSGVSKTSSPAGSEQHAVLVPLQIRIDTAILSFFSTTTIFGSPIDVTLSELALECFYPADDATAQAVRSLSGEPENLEDSTSQRSAAERIAS